MSIIKNYGFMWERQYICRGRGSNAGHLKGRFRGMEADFREQIGVYILYDRNQRVVYVGQAGNGNARLFGRLKQHMDGAKRSRWEYFSWFGFKETNKTGYLNEAQNVSSSVSGFIYSSALDQLEAILITVIEPPLNKQAGKLGSARKFEQIIDPSVAPRSNSELYEEIAATKAIIEQIKVTADKW